MVTIAMRKKYVKKFETILSGDLESAEIIEESVYRFWMKWSETRYRFHSLKAPKQVNMYLAKLRQIYHLFKKDSYLKIKPELDKEKLKYIAYEHYQNLCPGKWALYAKDIEILDKQVVEDVTNVQTTDLYKCPRCKQRKCVFAEVQTRASDESATIFVKCVNCDNHFRR